jgi:hypothetical protein
VVTARAGEPPPSNVRSSPAAPPFPVEASWSAGPRITSPGCPPTEAPAASQIKSGRPALTILAGRRVGWIVT